MFRGQFFDPFSKHKHIRALKFNHRLNFAFGNQGIILLHIPVFWVVSAKF